VTMKPQCVFLYVNVTASFGFVVLRVAADWTAKSVGVIVYSGKLLKSR
jgi:hypothetical protein